jgi:hypothetical protein
MRFGLSGLFLAITGAALAALWSSPPSYTYVHTGRLNDITVIGDGWLYGTDLKTENRKFFKSCTLSINNFSELVANIGDSQLTLDPRIQVEGSSIEKLRCFPDGHVAMLLTEESAPCHFGQLNLAVTLSSGKSCVIGDEQLRSTPVVSKPNSTAGYIQSGWLLQQESLVDRFKKVSFGELVIIVVVCGILIQMFRTTPMRQGLDEDKRSSPAGQD